jgi:hypothetical protein
LIPVIQMNSKKYDNHIILKYLKKHHHESEIKVIATTSEQFISIEFDGLRFLDSIQFISGSLENLVFNMKKNSPEKFKYTRQQFDDPEKFELICRKGIYPYEFLTDFKQFDLPDLPSIDCFYSKLSGQGISLDDYEHARNVWSIFDCQKFLDYHTLYVISDVTFLADIFEEFRNCAMKFYGLEVLHYYGIPGLTLDAALKYTKCKIGLITDVDTLLMFEGAVRGGQANVYGRYSKANRPDLPDYDPSKPTKYLKLFDAVSLYGTTMCHALPCGEFKFLNEEQMYMLDWMRVPEDSEIGYLLEVDLYCPEDTHKIQNSYPLCPTKMRVSEEMLSSYQRDLGKKLGVNFDSKVNKLVATFYPKKKYILHFRNLQYYVSHGMVVNKIHRILSFKQSPWLAPYIQYNVDMRRLAESAEERQFFKLMVNALYGKLLFNARNAKNIKLVSDAKQARRYFSRPDFESCRYINSDLVVIGMRTTTARIDKPISAGVSILEISKLLMYRFRYDVLGSYFGERCEVLMTDTDSLLIEVTGEDPEIFEKKNLHLFDTSDYPKTHICYSERNKKALGTFSDDFSGRKIIEYVGLKPKLYSIILAEEGGEEGRKIAAKGVKYGYAKMHLKHNLFLECLRNEEKNIGRYHLITSKDQQLRTEEIKKLVLSPLDTKRFCTEGNYKTLAFGHFEIKH